MHIAIGSDHAGFLLKADLAKLLVDAGHDVDDLGTVDEERVDYPDFGAAVGRAVASGGTDVGVCVCGTGIGISIAANKIAGVRAAVVHDATSARLAKEHNDANVVCLGARLVGSEVARDALLAYLDATFQEGRHAGRIGKISALEEEGHQRQGAA